jgi:hypothetical protein
VDSAGSNRRNDIVDIGALRACSAEDRELIACGTEMAAFWQGFACASAALPAFGMIWGGFQSSTNFWTPRAPPKNRQTTGRDDKAGKATFVTILLNAPPSGILLSEQAVQHLSVLMVRQNLEKSQSSSLIEA